MKRFCLIPFSVFLCCLASIAQQPRVFILDGSRLVKIKNNIANRDKQALAFLDSLKTHAARFLEMKPVSVMDKEITPPSGSKHDYMSQAPYFWYDSSKPNGLPYLRRDGVRNPEINKITDHQTLDKIQDATRFLSLAWYFTGDEKYAQKAAALIRVCFLDEATKMNPNLDFGQGIPGINTGRGIGIIETRSLMHIADAAGLLTGSKSWQAADQAALQKWYGAYLSWLLNSKNGKDEHLAKNNHGTWYYAQAIDFALFSGDKEKARQLAEESKKRLDSQLTKEGSQPLELERTNALGYSTMNLDGWATVARLAKHCGVDLWNYQTSQKSGIRQALNWLLPYATGAKKFEYQQISPYKIQDLYDLLLEAAAGLQEPGYLAEAKKIANPGNHWLVDMLSGHSR